MCFCLQPSANAFVLVFAIRYCAHTKDTKGKSVVLNRQQWLQNIFWENILPAPQCITQKLKRLAQIWCTQLCLGIFRILATPLGRAVYYYRKMQNNHQCNTEIHRIRWRIFGWFTNKHPFTSSWVAEQVQLTWQLPNEFFDWDSIAYPSLAVEKRVISSAQIHTHTNFMVQT